MNASEIAMLVLDAQKGDKAAFETLCSTLYLSSHRFAIKLSKNTAIADDVTQEAWTYVAKDIKRLQEPSAFKAWLFRIVYRRFIDYTRKHPLTTNENTERAYTPNIDKQYDVLKLINKLPDIERHTIYLYYFEQMTTCEIGAVLEVPEGTVKSRLFRARNELSKWANEALCRTH